MFENNAILAFHHTSNRFFPGIDNLKPRRFFQVVDLIGSLGHHLYTGGGEGAATDNYISPVVLTFDDGYEDNYDILLKLADNGIRPLVFIPSDYIGRINHWDFSSSYFPSFHFDKSKIRTLVDNGVSIGSHGASHRCLTLMNDNRLAEDLDRSKKTLEDIIGNKITNLSFPFGRTNDRVNRVALELGYHFLFRLGGGRFGDKGPDYLRNRIPIYSFDNYYSIRAKLSPSNSRLEMIKLNIIRRLAAGTIIVQPGLK